MCMSSLATIEPLYWCGPFTIDTKLRLQFSFSNVCDCLLFSAADQQFGAELFRRPHTVSYWNVQYTTLQSSWEQCFRLHSSIRIASNRACNKCLQLEAVAIACHIPFAPLFTIYIFIRINFDVLRKRKTELEK